MQTKCLYIYFFDWIMNMNAILIKSSKFSKNIQKWIFVSNNFMSQNKIQSGCKSIYTKEWFPISP